MGRRKKNCEYNKTKIVSNPVQNRFWSDRELLTLVSSIQTYGIGETAKIAEAIQTKDEAAVKHFIALRKQKIRMSAEQEERNILKRRGNWNVLSPEELDKWPIIRKWRKIIQSQLMPCLKRQEFSKVVMVDLLQAFYDEVEEPSDPQVINTKAIYKFLLDCMKGNPPGELSLIDSGIVLALMDQLQELTTDLDLDEEQSFIQNFKKAKTFIPIKMKDEFQRSTYRRAQQLHNAIQINASGQGTSTGYNVPATLNEDEDKHIKVTEDLFAKLTKHRKLVQSMNPLNIPMWFLLKEQSCIHNKCDLGPRETFSTKRKLDE